MLLNTEEHLTIIKKISALSTMHNDVIGNYKQHFINKKFDYIVRVDNGVLIVPLSVVLSVKNLETIPEKKVKLVAESFQKCGDVYFFIRRYL